MQKNESILEIKNLSKYYIQNNTKSVILNNFNLSLNTEEFLCILGPSGCGKSTLLRCIAGFEEHSGSIFINGKLIEKPSSACIMVFQDFNQLFPWKTVEENISYAIRNCRTKDNELIKEMVNDNLSKVNLINFKKYYPYQLSGGMKQRVAIAKALAIHPKIILMDEPFASLDAISRRDLQNELLTINKSEKITTIFITHNIQEALILGTRTIVLGKQGSIILDEKNNLKKPVSPNSPEYGKYWQKYYNALQSIN